MLQENIRVLKQFPNIISVKSLLDLTFLDTSATYNAIKSMDNVVYKQQYGSTFIEDLLFSLKNFRYSITSLQLLQKYNVIKTIKEKLVQVDLHLLENMILEKNWSNFNLIEKDLKQLIQTYYELYTEVGNLISGYEQEFINFSSIENKKVIRDLLRVSIDLQQLLS
jgi:hypothetical protein